MHTPGKLTILLIACATSALAATSVTQSTSSEEVGLEDVAQVVVEVQGATRTAQVNLPVTDEFELLGRSSSTSTSIRDDGSGAPVIERSQRFVFTIHPRRVGRVEVPAAIVIVDGVTLSGAATKLDVIEGHAASARTPDSDAFASIFGADPFAGLRSGSAFDRFFGADTPPPLDARLLMSVEKPSVYAGEQATMSVYLLTRSDLSSVGALRLPTIDGAVSQELEVPRKLTARSMTVDGREYQAFLIARRALFPSRTGTLSIPAGAIEIEAGGPSRTIRSRPFSVEVKPVPPGGESGESVGAWRISAVKSQSAPPRVGQPIPIEVSVDGRGDLQAVGEPVLQLEGRARVIPPTVKDVPSRRDGAVGGKRIFEFLVIPDAPGPLSLAPVRYPYFNPATGRHEVAVSEPLTLDVASGASAAPIATAPAPTQVPPPAAEPTRLTPASGIPGPELLVVLLAVLITAWGLRRWFLSRRDRAPRAKSLGALRRGAARNLALARAAEKSGRPAQAIELAEQALITIGSASGLALDAVDLDRVAKDSARPPIAAWARTMLSCRRARFMSLQPELVSDILARTGESVASLSRQPPRSSDALAG